jgi:glycosyltransferase involved in cell wall biosynthesis
MGKAGSRYPRVTVLMPVYNGGRFLHEAIESILRQTFSEFEFLIIDDGSKDASAEIIRSYMDGRIKLVQNERNMGLIFSLNKGLALAKSEYIARMDADDVSFPERLKNQVAFMDANPEVGICGSWLETFGIKSKCLWRSAVHDAQIRCEHIFHSSIYHPTVILRRDLFDKYSLSYEETMMHAEDYDLWVRASRYMRMANISEVLLGYRIHADNVGQIYAMQQDRCAQAIRLRQLSKLGLQPSDAEACLHAKISCTKIEKSAAFLKQAEHWLLKMREANRSRNAFPEPSFSEVLSKKWFEMCYAASTLGFVTLWAFLKSSLRPRRSFYNYDQIKLFIKCSLRH